MLDAFSEIQPASRERIWSTLNKCLFALIAVGIALPLAYRALPMVKEKSVQDARLAQLETDLDLARMLNKRLTREVRLLEINDPDFLAPFVRDRLGCMKEGETIFRLERREP